MSESYTASFHNGGMEKDGIDSSGRRRSKLYQACREHNIRDPKYCEKQEHIVKGGLHETWIDIPPKQAYEQIFGEAFREYNSKQRKKERQFNSYWEKVKKSKDLVPVREALITIGNVEQIPDPEVQKKIYKDFLEEFKKKNPNMVVIGAYYHADEMRNDGKGGFVKGAPHMHLDYIPVAYNCKRGQKIQNSMNGALKEQGILNIEIDPEVAQKVYGLRDKSKRKNEEEDIHKQPDTSPEALKKRLKCFGKEDAEQTEQTEEPEQTEQTEESDTEGGKITKTRTVTNLIQWTQAQRNLLMKIARENGLTIENPNEKRDHLTTEDYIYSKDPSLKSDVYALGEKLLQDVKEVDAEKAEMVEWDKDLSKREEATNQRAEEAKKQEQKNRDYVDYKEKYFRQRKQELNDWEEDLTKKQTFFDSAKKHVSESLHKFVKNLKWEKKRVEEKDKALDQMLRETKILAERAVAVNDTKAIPYPNFANDINFDDARQMASKRDGNGLCAWFNGLEHKFGAWLHKAQYFAKHFWNKTPDELMIVAEDMRNSYCSNLGDYVEKRMSGNTLSQIREVRKIKEAIPKLQERKQELNKPKSRTRHEIDWWD